MVSLHEVRKIAVIENAFPRRDDVVWEISKNLNEWLKEIASCS